jgi:hypothetical protein
MDNKGNDQSKATDQVKKDVAKDDQVKTEVKTDLMATKVKCSYHPPPMLTIDRFMSVSA